MTAASYAIAADGSGRERKLFAGTGLDFSSDGRHADIPDGGRIDDAETRVLLEGEKRHRNGRLSPSGELLAYELREGEQSEVYLTRFPSAEGRWQVSTGGGRDARWSRDGSRLYFLDDELALHEVSVRSTPSIELGRPRLLFENRTNGIGLGRGYDIAADGRLLVVRVISDDRKRYIVFVQNWYGEFEKP